MPGVTASAHWHNNEWNYHGPPIPHDTLVSVPYNGQRLPARICDAGFPYPFRDEFRYIVRGRFYPESTFLPGNEQWAYSMCAITMGFNESELVITGPDEIQQEIEELYYADHEALRSEYEGEGE